MLERHAGFDLQVDEIHQQDGIAHDDAGQGNHADHAGCGVLRLQQGVARHDTNDGQRNRRHDDQRRQIRAKLGHHQQVNQHQPHRIGSPHIAECLVGDLPLTIPLDGVATPCVNRLADEKFAQGLAIRRLDFCDGAAHLEHAVQRAVQLARHVGGDKVHGQQILVDHGLLALAVGKGNQLSDRHQLARSATHGQLQQGRQIAMPLSGQLDQGGRRVFAAVVQIGGGFTGQPRTQSGHDGLLGNAQGSCLAAVHQQQLARCSRNAAVIDVHHAVGLFKDGAYGLGHAAPAFGIGTINFSHDGCHHRWAWRHLHHFDVGTPALTNGLQLGAQPCGNGVALRFALVLFHQLDLDVTHLAASAKVVLTHQAVEVDGRGRTGIRLVIGHLGLLGQVGTQFAQDSSGVFNGRAHRHVHHHLEL